MSDTVHHPVHHPVLLAHRAKSLSAWISLATLSMLVGCATATDAPPAPISLPSAFSHGGVEWQAAQARDGEIKPEWWRDFHDAVLNDLMTRLNADNQNIAIALANYQKAQAAIQSARAAALPTLAVNGAATRSGTHDANNIDTADSLKLVSAWEIDLWGNIAHNVKANRAQAEASRATLINAQLSAQAALAQAYFALRITDEEIALTQRLMAGYQRSAHITDAQYRAGLVTSLDVSQAQTTLSNAQKQLLALQLSRTQYEDAIAVLTGQIPAQYHLDAAALSPLVDMPAAVPAQLLLRRPDVAAAERTMVAANEQIGVAKTAFFPTLSLSASGGYGNTRAAELINPLNFAWSLGAAAVGSIIDGGAHSAQLAQARAGYAATVAQYRQAVLTAMQQVEDSLASVDNLRQQSVYAHAALLSARQAEQSATNQYMAGTVDYTTVVSNQASRYNAEIADLQVLGQRYNAAIGLIQNLGGGWQGFSAQP